MAKKPKPKPKPKPPAVNLKLINSINSETIARLNNKNPATDRPVYNIQDPHKKQFIRNTSCWINGVTNISCFSPAQLSGATWSHRAGTLITKKHMVYARHFPISILPGGTPILFVDENNNVVTRNLVSQAADTNSDLLVGLLDSEVPDNIKIAPVLPSDFIKYFPTGKSFLVVALDQEEKAILRLCFSLQDNQFYTGELNEPWIDPSLSKHSNFCEQIVVGDSGNPCFTIINNQLVLLGCWHSIAYGPHVGARYTVVNDLIERLSPGQNYRLSQVSLDSFR